MVVLAWENWRRRQAIGVSGTDRTRDLNLKCGLLVDFSLGDFLFIASHNPKSTLQANLAGCIRYHVSDGESIADIVRAVPQQGMR